MDNKRIILISILLPFVMIGCTKKRADRFNQSQGLHLMAMDAFDGKMFPVKTMAAIANTNGTTATSPDAIKIQTTDNRRNSSGESVALMGNILPFVKYESTAELLPKDLEFRARPNTTSNYSVMYRVTDKYLKVLKVAKPEDLDWQEVHYVEETLEDGRLAIPLIGYPLSLIQVENSLNSDNEPTNMLIEVPVQYREQASYFRINKNRYERFEALALNETFPTAFFGFGKDSTPAEEWYFLESIIEGSEDYEAFTGIVFNSDHNNGSVSRVIFKRSQRGDAIEIRSADLPLEYQNRSQQEKSLDQSVVMTIPAELFDLRLAPDGNDKSLRAEKFSGASIEERKFAQLSLAQVSSAFIKPNFKSEITEVNINDGYFSFVVSTSGQEAVFDNPFNDRDYKREVRAKVRYSFYKKSQRIRDLAARGCTIPYKPRIAFTDDYKYFGTFTTRKKFLTSYDIMSRRDLEDKYLITRHNPNCVVTYHLGELTPDKYKRQAKQIVDAWTTTLQKNGVKFKIQYSDERVKTGDIRYNSIDIVESEVLAGWSGIAQTVADISTGEIIYSQAQIQARAVRAGVKRSILTYLRNKLGITDVGYSGDAIHFSNLDLDKISLAKAQSFVWNLVQSGLNMQYLFVDPKVNPGAFQAYAATNAPLSPDALQNPAFKQINEKSIPDSIKSHQSTKELFGGFGAKSLHACDKNDQFLYGDIDRLIEKFCGPGSSDNLGLDAFIKSQNRANTQIDSRINPQIIDACADKILNSPESMIFQGTGLHEVGHTLALRHNFKASSDSLNFYKASDNVSPHAVNSRFSSVMDYTSNDHDRTDIPGKYDVAAIRFIYDGDVTGTNGEAPSGLIKVNVNQSLRAQGILGKMHPYKFCTDEQAYSYADAFCITGDYGSTPLEMVEEHILSFKDALANYRLRYDSPTAYQLDLISSKFLPLMRIYEEWRYQLRRFVGESNKYLTEFTTAEQYEKFLEDLSKSNAEFGRVYTTYYPAVRKIHAFFLDEIALMPNRYCIFGKKNGSDVENTKAVELSKIRAFAGDDETVLSCQSPAVNNFVKSKGPAFQGLSLLNDIGYETWSAFYDRSTFIYSGGSGLAAPYGAADVLGTAGYRLNGFLLMASRIGLHPISRQEMFFPSMMDEPNFRKLTSDKFVDRVTKGVSLPPYISGHFNNFESERPLIESMFSIFRQSLDIPGQVQQSLSRQNPYATFITTSDASSWALASIKLGFLTVGAASPENRVAIQLISQANLANTLAVNGATYGPLTGEFIETVIKPRIAANLRAVLEDPAHKVTVGEMKAFMSSFDAIKSEAPQYALFIDMAFKAEKTLLDAVGSARIPDTTPWEEIAAEVPAELALRIRGFNVEDLMRRASEVFWLYNSAYDSYLQDPTELNAQAELIVNTLTRSSMLRN